MPLSERKPKIVIADSSQIDDCEAVVAEVLVDLLGMEPDSYLITDESNLSDFSSVGLPKELSKNTTTLNELYDAWDQWVIPEIEAKFHVSLTKTSIRLVHLADLITKARVVH